MDQLSLTTRIPDHIAELHREAATARLTKPTRPALLRMPHVDRKSLLEPIRRTLRGAAW
jgi:hypothetical protein